MSNSFKITDEEINQVVLYSPYSLADSPASLGQGASEIKGYFYRFIFELAKKINLHLEEIKEAFDNQDTVNASLMEMDTYLGGTISKQIQDHNSSLNTHPDIRNDLISHENSESAHLDIRNKIDAVSKECELARALASGKMQVHTFDDIIELLEYLDSKEEKHIGDIFLLSDPTMPDFTLFELEATRRDGDIELSYVDVSSGIVSLEANKSYYYNGIRIISSEGNLETSYLAKQEELDKLETLLLESLQRINATIEALQATLQGKENIMETVESSEPCVVISKGKEYHLGKRTSLLLELDGTSKIEAIVSFIVGGQGLTLDAPSEMYFSGDDTLDGRLYPVTNRAYEINIKTVCGIVWARVGALDYEVIEVE